MGVEVGVRVTVGLAVGVPVGQPPGGQGVGVGVMVGVGPTTRVTEPPEARAGISTPKGSASDTTGKSRALVPSVRALRVTTARTALPLGPGVPASELAQPKRRLPTSTISSGQKTDLPVLPRKEVLATLTNPTRAGLKVSVNS
jgi:hypothetical protein